MLIKKISLPNSQLFTSAMSMLGLTSVNLMTLVLALFLISYLYIKWSFQYWERRNVPYLPPEIPFGNVKKTILGKENIVVSLKTIYDEMKHKGWKHGGIYILNKAHYFPLDLDIIKKILTKDFPSFMDRNLYCNEKDPLQAHLLHLTGTKWRNLRAKLTPTFTSGKMKMMFEVMVESLRDLKQRMERECEKQKPIDIKEILACYTTNVIGSCAFGLDCKALEDDDAPFRKFGRELMMVSRWRALKRTFAEVFPGVAKALRVSVANRKNYSFIMKVMEDTIEYREKHNYVRNDFMQMMIELKNKVPKSQDDHDGKPLTMDEIGSQCLVFFAAGFETSSTLMSFVLYELSRHPEIQDKVREEVVRVLKTYNNRFTYESIQEMTYLAQVIDETLRMHPPVALTARRCVKQYEVPHHNLTIEKGTDVIISILGIHYDEEYYPNPTKFDPDRFSEENKNARNSYSFLPFGEGPRNCIGLRFGLLQSKIGVAAMIIGYKFKINRKTIDPLVYKRSTRVLAVEGEVWLDVEKV